MPSRESIIRTVNRQLEDYRRRLGEESEEWEYLTTKLNNLLGEPKYNKSGLPYYSRSPAAKYNSRALQEAYAAVTGKNTAATIEQEYIKDLVNMKGIETVNSENVRRYAKVKNKTYHYYSELYNYLKELYEEEYGEGSWDDSDLRDEYYMRGAMEKLPDDTVFWLDDEITNLLGGGFLRGIDAALNDLEAFNDQQKKRAKSRADASRKSGKINNEDIKKEFGSGAF